MMMMMMMMPVVISGHTGKMKRSRQPFSAAFLLRKIQFFSGSNPQFQTWLKGISAGPSCCISMQQKEETTMTNGFRFSIENHWTSTHAGNEHPQAMRETSLSRPTYVILLFVHPLNSLLLLVKQYFLVANSPIS